MDDLRPARIIEAYASTAGLCGEGPRPVSARARGLRRRPMHLFAFLSGLGLMLCLSTANAQSPASLQLKGAPEPQVVQPLLASELPSSLDKYARAARELDSYSVKFQQSYQRFIRTLDSLSRADKPLRATPGCLIPDLAEPYVSALSSWELYHVQARSVRALQRRLQLYEQGGYTVGLTPDIQDRLKRALEDYERIRQEHVNLQALIRNQVEGEIRRIGCNPADVSAPAVVEVAAKDKAAADKAPKEKPIQPSDNRRSVATLSEDPEASGAEASSAPLPPPEELTADERMLPVESVESSTATPLPYPGMNDNSADKASPLADLDSEGRTPTTEKPGSAPGEATPTVKNAESPKEAATPTPAPPAPTATPTPIPEGLKVHFSVDNRQCRQSVQVYLDGNLIGTVTGEATTTFTSTEGKHRLCLGQDAQGKACSQNNDYIRVILYDGFAVRPRC